MKPASPLPWMIIERYRPVVTSISAATGDTVCDNEDYYPHAVEVDDMKFIAHACNLHHDLVAACTALYKTSNDDAARAMALKALEKAGVH